MKATARDKERKRLTLKERHLSIPELSHAQNPPRLRRSSPLVPVRNESECGCVGCVCWMGGVLMATIISHCSELASYWDPACDKRHRTPAYAISPQPPPPPRNPPPPILLADSCERMSHRATAGLRTLPARSLSLHAA